MQSINFISWIGEKAADLYGTGLFPSVLIAQAALESGWGQSELSKVANNLFGVKAGNAWKGRSVVMPTREVVKGESKMVNGRFRAYDDAKDSIADRNQFLKENPRYSKAGVFSAKTPEEQAIALQAAGYATDPGYAKSIISLINKHGLKRFDISGKKKGG